jgi:hypothetical protein
VDWIYMFYSCGWLVCSIERERVTEAQCRALAMYERVRTEPSGEVVYAEACLSPAGVWWPGRIGGPVAR